MDILTTVSYQYINDLKTKEIFERSPTFALSLGYKSFLPYFFNEGIYKFFYSESLSQRKKSLAGSLSQYANPDLIEKEKDIAWELVVKEKNALSRC